MEWNELKNNWEAYKEDRLSDQLLSRTQLEAILTDASRPKSFVLFKAGALRVALYTLMMLACQAC